VGVDTPYSASVTKASSTIVSGGEYRRSRDPQRNTYRRRIGFRRKRTALNEYFARRMTYATEDSMFNFS